VKTNPKFYRGQGATKHAHPLTAFPRSSSCRTDHNGMNVKEGGQQHAFVLVLGAKV